jgi:hypothetical protein
MRNVFLVGACIAALAVGGSAQGQTVLTGGRLAKLKDRPGNTRDNVAVKFAQEPALFSIVNPACPQVSSVRLKASNGRQINVVLPCERWRARSNGFQYADSMAAHGGVYKIIYKFGKLIIKLKGPNYAAIGGPLDYLEAGLTVGDQTVCGRFDRNFRRNDSSTVLIQGPSSACQPLDNRTPTPTSCPSGYECAVFNVETGTGALKPVDNATKSTWFRILDLTGAGLAENGTNGQFNSGPMVLARSRNVDTSGRADLILEHTAFLGAPKPTGGGTGKTCWKIEQDQASTGWLDCNGGSDADVDLTVDSNGVGAGTQPVLTMGVSDDSGAGAGVLRVRVQIAEPSDPAADCAAQDYSSSPVVTTVFTVGTATSVINNTIQHATNPTKYPNPDGVVTLPGLPFDCANWGLDAAAATSIAAPLYKFDVVPGGILPGTYDVAQVLRLRLDPIGGGNAETPTPSAGTPTTIESPTITRTPSPVRPTPTPQTALCPIGMTCAAFNIVPGPGQLTGQPGTSDTFLELFDFVGIGLSNVTDGQWGPGPILLAKGAPDGNNVASLTWLGENFLGATLNQEVQGFGSTGTVCLHIKQDPAATGWMTCGAGLSGNVAYSVDSNFENPDSAPVLTMPTGADPSAPVGTALIRVQIQITLADQNGADCRLLDWGSADFLTTAFTTRLATSEVLEPIVPTMVAPDQHGPNQNFSLGGLAFSCASWGLATGVNSSIVAPFGALGFPAPIVKENIDVAMLGRLELQPAAFPNPNDTPTPTRTTTNTLAPTATVTVTNTATVTPTLTLTSAPTITPTVTITSTPTITPTITPTSTRTNTPTKTPRMISNVNLVNSSGDYQNNTGSFVGQCRDQAKTTASSVLSSDGTQLSTQFRQSLVADCEVTLGSRTANQTADYVVEFDVWCPAGAPYTLNVATALRGALTLRRDEDAGCSGAMNGASQGSMGNVSGMLLQGGSLASGTLDLSTGFSGNCACTLLGCTGCDSLPVAQSGTAKISGTGTGSTIRHRIEFGWDAACSSNGSTWTQGAECAFRFGVQSDNSCMYGDDYPGNPARDINSDGHFVTIVGSCGDASTPTPTTTATSTVSPGGPTLTPTPTPTQTPLAAALGTLNFKVDDGPGVLSGGSTTCPGCPCQLDGGTGGRITGCSSSGSLFVAHGNPTGSFCNACNSTRGDFTTMPSTGFDLYAGAPGADGVADLTIVAPVVVRAKVPPATPNCSDCETCWRFEQDAEPGFVDCDGGSAADVLLEINSNGSSAPPTTAGRLVGSYLLTGADAGPGAAVILAHVKKFRMKPSGQCPGPDDAAWATPDDEFPAVLVTAKATSRVTSPRKCSGSVFGVACPDKNPYEANVQGTNFNCASWIGGSGPALVLPMNVLDDPFGGDYANGDMASVLRLEQWDGVVQQ